jgi:hypothetical protein
MLNLPLPRNTCQWGIGSTETYRNNSRALFKYPGFKGYGTNLQNPSANICTLYIPDTGKVFVQADQAGAEALIVAYLCPPGNFRELFLQRIKPHIYVAMHIFADFWEKEMHKDGFKSFRIKDYLAAPIKILKTLPDFKHLSNKIKHNDLKYFIGKKCCHSLNYRMRSNTFRFNVLKDSEGKVVLSGYESDKFCSIYHGLFPEIEGIWHKDIDRVLATTKIMYNLFNHPKEFYGKVDDKLTREATSFVPQSTVGSITNYAFCNLQNYIEQNKLEWDLLNNKHDSILVQAPESESMAAAKAVKESLELDLVSPRGEPFKMRSEVSIGYNWGKYDEDKNPKGMKEVEL